jgi:hypothetical protein
MAYCRHVEDHLTRANGGHLVRIVGPGFDLVRRWFTDGIPIGIVVRGIDTRVERHNRDHPAPESPTPSSYPSSSAGGPRPLRIEFCDADVRAIFTRWRRALGLPLRPAEPEGDGVEAAGEPASSSRRPSLTKHLDRAIERLTRAAGRLDLSDAFREGVSAVLSDVALARDRAKGARGPARDEIIDGLRQLDERVLQLARDTASPALVAQARREAEQDLAPYAGRLAPDRWDTALAAAADQRLREILGLPIVDT